MGVNVGSKTERLIACVSACAGLGLAMRPAAGSYVVVVHSPSGAAQTFELTKK